MFDPISDFWDPLQTLIVPICMQRRVASEPAHQSYNNLADLSFNLPTVGPADQYMSSLTCIYNRGFTLYLGKSQTYKNAN